MRSLCDPNAGGQREVCIGLGQTGASVRCTSYDGQYDEVLETVL